MAKIDNQGVRMGGEPGGEGKNPASASSENGRKWDEECLGNILATTIRCNCLCVCVAGRGMCPSGRTPTTHKGGATKCEKRCAMEAVGQCGEKTSRWDRKDENVAQAASPAKKKDR